MAASRIADCFNWHLNDGLNANTGSEAGQMRTAARCSPKQTNKLYQCVNQRLTHSTDCLRLPWKWLNWPTAAPAAEMTKYYGQIVSGMAKWLISWRRTISHSQSLHPMRRSRPGVIYKVDNASQLVAFFAI